MGLHINEQQRTMWIMGPLPRILKHTHARGNELQLIQDSTQPPFAIKRTMWIMGPSGPTGRPDPTAVAADRNLTANVRILRICECLKKREEAVW